MIIYEEAVKELFESLFGPEPNNFYAELYTLISKADAGHRELLRLAFPMEVKVFEAWQRSDNQVEFFARFGFTVPV